LKTKIEEVREKERKRDERQEMKGKGKCRGINGQGGKRD
jgi:hypothetical protein